MSAQVTDAHRELARRIMFEFTQAGTATASDVRMAAQIIADSEAKATAQLRADRDYNHECINRLASATGTLGEKSGRVVEVALSTIARAERAEAELSAEQDMRSCVEAELAAERVQAKLWEDKCHELIAPHYILDPCLRAHKFREALQFHPVLNNNPAPFWKKYGGPNDT